MNLRQLTYFLAVAAEGSFSRAASALHMTQPPLSLAVAQLEKELGVQLLQRHPHGVSPTAAGEYLTANGSALLNHAARIETHLRGLGQGVAGQLHIAAVPSFTWAYLPPLLKAFAAEAPDVAVELSDPAPVEVIAQVGSGLADVGFVATGNAGALAKLVANDVHICTVQQMPLVAVLPPHYVDSPPVIDLAQLMDEVWMVPQRYPRFPGLIEQIEDVWATMRMRPGTVRSVSTLQTAVPLVAAGMGIAIMPSSVAELAGSHIATRQIMQPVGALEGAMVWSKDRTLTAAAERFVNLTLAAAGKNFPVGRLTAG